MENSNQPEIDPKLWAIAKKRVSFKKHLATYIVINGLLWIIWYLSGNRFYESKIPWPVWPMLGWGIGIIFDYLEAYVYPRDKSIENEYRKLKGKNQ